MSSGAFWRSPSIVTTISPRARARPACIAGCWPKLRLKRTARTRGSAACRRSSVGERRRRSSRRRRRSARTAGRPLERRDRAPVELVDASPPRCRRDDDRDAAARPRARRPPREPRTPRVRPSRPEPTLTPRGRAVRARDADRRPSRCAATALPRLVRERRRRRPTSCSRSGSPPARRASGRRCATSCRTSRSSSSGRGGRRACSSSGPPARRTRSGCFGDALVREPRRSRSAARPTASTPPTSCSTSSARATASWRWKDEDELAQRRRRRASSRRTRRRAIRAEARRVIAADPFPTGWEDWEPDPTLAAPRPRRRSSRPLSSAGSPRRSAVLAAGDRERRERADGDDDRADPDRRRRARR